ncbi:auxin efflux carrier [Bisporella sp. PMI_857]|nr:auxin efflux carrier [Bisporella sp. PMI_857]
MAQVGLLNSFLAAIQASLSVLLVIFYGGLAAHFKLLDSTSSKSISKICVKMFLPALLLTKIGSELHYGSAHRYLIILIWAFVCHFISFLIGVAAHLLFGMPDWITAAIMFNNTTSYPLLLIQSLDETGILQNLIVTDETTREAIERAKSYFLVFATVSSCLTFAVGPRLIDSEHPPDPEEDKTESDDEDDEIRDVEDGDGQHNDLSSNERTQLLVPDRVQRASVVSNSFFPSRSQDTSPNPVLANRRPSLIPRRRWKVLGDRAKWWLLFLYDFLNAPLLGAVLGAVIGMVPAIQRAFFNDTFDGGIFSAWLTPSLKNIGSIFVPLPVIVAGVSLYLSYKKSKGDASPDAGTPWLTTIFILVIRFVIWPLVSIGSIYLLAKKTDVLGDDPMLWFAMMLMPTGPSAMKLIAMVEVSGAKEEDEHKISKLLTISYIISPVLALTVVGSLRASQAAINT